MPKWFRWFMEEVFAWDPGKPPPSQGKSLNLRSDGMYLIAKERLRQIEVEGFTAEHDDAHADGELAMAACCYATGTPLYIEAGGPGEFLFKDPWPFEPPADKRPYFGIGPTHPNELSDAERLDLMVKAGALIAAEVDRLLREQDSPQKEIPF